MGKKFFYKIIGLLIILLISASPVLAATYTYDDLGRLLTVTYDSGLKLTYTYDAAGNIVGVKQSGGNLFVQRLAGLNRIETAVAVSCEGWPDGANAVILARDDDFPDALAGAPLAKKYNAPILLTGTKVLSQETKAEIVRLNPSQIILLGSPGAISLEIEQTLKANYTITRLGGSDRFETAKKIAEALGNKGKAVIAYGFNFPDALAISPWAAYNGVPILLSDKDVVPDATKNALKSLGVTQTIIVGSNGVISDKVASTLPSPQRYSGANRYQTAIDIAKRLESNTNSVFVATGENFPDALAGSALAARTKGAIVLVDKTMSEPKVNEFLGVNRGKVKILNVLGSTGVVPQSAVDTISQLVK